MKTSAKPEFKQSGELVQRLDLSRLIALVGRDTVNNAKTQGTGQGVLNQAVQVKDNNG